MFNDNKKPKTPKSQAYPTVGDLFQAERPLNFPSNNNLSPKEELLQEEGHFSFRTIKKLSVIAKVKEKARKWKQNLGKKKLDCNEDYEKDEDLSRHEAPSKLFTIRRPSSNKKERMRLHTMPGVSFNEKQVVSYSMDRGYSEHCEKIIHNKRLPVLNLKGGESDLKDTPSLRDKPPKNSGEDEKETDHEFEETDEEAKVMSTSSPETIEEDQELSEIDGEKGRAPTPSPEEGALEGELQGIDSPPSQMKSLVEAVAEKLAPVSDFGSLDSEQELEQKQEEEEEEQVLSLEDTSTSTIEGGSFVSGVDSNDHKCEEESKSGQRRSDRGVSVKEFIKNKLEPGDDERALSQVISEAISPRKTPGDKGVIEKVKEVVTLLILAEQRQMKQEQEQEPEQEQSSASHLLRHSSSSFQIPISTNAYEDELDVEEETQGRILQAN